MFLNTRYLSPVVLDGLTTAPPDSYEYHEWWDEQNRRCLEGYSVGDVSITGRHYYYLNFKKILSAKKKGERGKLYQPPRFIDIDHEFFWEVDKAWKMGKDLLVLKRRQAGFSYKSSALAEYQFSFVPDSKTIITAGVEKWAKHTFDMAYRGLQSLDKTEFYKNRWPDSPEKGEVQAAYWEDIAGRRVLTGFMSNIRRITATHPQALSATSAGLTIYEEIGLFKNVKAVKGYNDAAMEEQGEKTGFQLLIGTGGEEHSSIDEVTEMVYNPDTYGLMSYDNRYDEESLLMDPSEIRRPGLKKVAMFISGDRFFNIDEDGNSLIAQSRQKILDRRKILEKDKKAWLGYVTQFPLTIEEALMVPDGNIFDIQALRQQKGVLMKYEHMQDCLRLINIEWIKDTQGNITGVEWHDDPDGRYRMTEPPFIKEGEKEVERGEYIAGTDSFDKSDVADPNTASFGSCKIMRLGMSDCPVITVTERPASSDEFYEDTAKMCVMYGHARNMIEYSNVMIGDWYLKHNFGYLLKERPMVASATSIRPGQENRWGGDPNLIHVAIQMLADWIAKGGASRIMDIQTIDKLIKYRPDSNCDETDAFAWLICHRNDLIQIQSKPKKVYSSPMPRYVMRGERMVRQF